MEGKRKIFSSIIVLIFIGGGIVYYAMFRDQKKLQKPPTKIKPLDHDSIAGAGHEVPVLMGTKPEKNSKDGSIKIVEDFVKSNAKNPATFEFLEWSEISSEGGYWKVRCKYRGISSFNAEVTTNAWFYIQNNKVVRTKIISKI